KAHIQEVTLRGAIKIADQNTGHRAINAQYVITGGKNYYRVETMSGVGCEYILIDAHTGRTQSERQAPSPCIAIPETYSFPLRISLERAISIAESIGDYAETIELKNIGGNLI